MSHEDSAVAINIASVSGESTTLMAGEYGDIVQPNGEISKSKYLIDTGDDISVVPLTMRSKHPIPASLQLIAANGTVISTYG
ncbi:hypothetical protein NPIL_362171 [Nephila pilipes]|uniref:Peptidase A2 domain-containing protein n=1 Tax=Nephila pilipes TaxID=299642 RepID=A0A8X6MY49_NEPPI|nr:hypothetical protein NPIL_362171 [Nephila pilipes]